MATFQRRSTPTRQFSSQGVVGTSPVDHPWTVQRPYLDRLWTEKRGSGPPRLSNVCRGGKNSHANSKVVRKIRPTQVEIVERTDNGGCDQFGDRSRIHKRRRRRGWV